MQDNHKPFWQAEQSRGLAIQRGFEYACSKGLSMSLRAKCMESLLKNCIQNGMKEKFES